MDYNGLPTQQCGSQSWVWNYLYHKWFTIAWLGSAVSNKQDEAVIQSASSTILGMGAIEEF
jgi:hypothetical protein